jgi:hydrogenase nickel incorporation protein HypA/HybF
MVHRVRVKIGELSGVEPELLDHAFKVVRDRGVCQDAELEIERVPAQWACPECGRMGEPGERLQCSLCRIPLALAGGDEILLEQIDLEVP